MIQLFNMRIEALVEQLKKTGLKITCIPRWKKAILNELLSHYVKLKRSAFKFERLAELVQYIEDFEGNLYDMMKDLGEKVERGESDNREHLLKNLIVWNFSLIDGAYEKEVLGRAYRNGVETK